MPIKRTLWQMYENFKAVAYNPNNPVVVNEVDDEIGYFLGKRKFFGATKNTKKILLEMIPSEEWEIMREKAWDGFITEGSYYVSHNGHYYDRNSYES